MVGILLLFGLVLLGSTLVFVAGVTLVDDLRTSASEERAEMAMHQFDNDVSTQIDSSRRRGTVTLGDRGSMAVGPAGVVTIEAADRFGGRCTIVEDVELGTVTRESDDGRVLAYQAGGIFERSDAGGGLVSNPDVEYYEDEDGGGTVHGVDVSIASLEGAVGGGEHEARYERSDPTEAADCFEEIRFARTITFEVEGTPYHEGWETFLAAEFEVAETDNRIDHDPGERSVRVEAEIDRERPFSEHVSLWPTIYGGLAVADDGSTAKFDSIAVDGYDSRNGTYDESTAVDDLFVADVDRAMFMPGSEVEGYPVATNDLQVQPNVDVSPFAYYRGTDRSPGGADGYRAVELSESVDPIDPVDDEVETAMASLDGRAEPGSGAATIDAGLYHEPDSFDLTDATIDTADGDVYIATNGSVALSDVSVEGDGSVHVYTRGSVDVADVSVPADRADAFWVYGSSDTDVRVGDGFQGVVYAPGEGELVIDDGAEIHGAVVGATPAIGDDVSIHFDRSIRTDVPIPDADTDVEFDEEVRRPVDVSFLLDRSGSMGEHCVSYHWLGFCTENHPGNDPDGLRLDATRGFVGALNASAGDRAGVVEFDRDARELQRLTNDFEAVNASLEDNHDGGTNMAEGIERGLAQHDGSGSVTENEKVVILLSDGENDPASPANEETREAARTAAAENVTIHTIGLGDDVDDDLLAYVAEETGGEFLSVDDADELEGIFTDIATNVTEPDERTFDEEMPHEPARTTNEHAVAVVEHVIELDES